MNHITFEQFEESCNAAGLSAVQCTPEHWQICGGALLVNFYPCTTRGQRYYVSGTTGGRKGGIEKAIAAANAPPPANAWKKDRRRAKGYYAIKRRMLAKCNKCHWCGNGLTQDTATLDHKIPLHRGGLDNANNWVLACEPCNKQRGHKMPELAKGGTQ